MRRTRTTKDVTLLGLANGSAENVRQLFAAGVHFFRRDLSRECIDAACVLGAT